MGKNSKKSRTWPSLPSPLAAPVIDNHTHLATHELAIPKASDVRPSVETQIEWARQVGVVGAITSACELPEFQPTCELARQLTGVRVAVAIHPNEAALHAGHADPSPDGLTPQPLSHHVPLVDALVEVEQALKDPMVVAVGETGLDYFRTAQPGRTAQIESFRSHLQLAREVDLPVQIHDRDAHADTLAVLDESADVSQRIVFHCYSGDREMAERLKDNGWYASFAGPLTYPANTHLREALLTLPRELVLVETDAPYLTPVPERGNPNASYVMAHTVRMIADLWDLAEDEACHQLMENTQRVYGRWV
ncbi:TatD family hydrolase [Schaalia sp. ZJ405]|uniref:TatD family hydrolase n=1 Tax=Schaalia sp. ZJ405 TaxID=2709403 RepID=UPI0013ED3AE4|nr:TatD family hydrolase [Schaalia sp. ZJ405]QPK81656.1 TatD family hydrolase [Schaalia sp. ZJ405]